MDPQPEPVHVTLHSVLRSYFVSYVQNGPRKVERLEELHGAGNVTLEHYLRFIARYAYDEEYYNTGESC